MGRPSGYTQDISDIICERLSNGESLRAICADDAMPAKSTVFKWLGEQPQFSDRYARARETQADAIFDEILDIADDGSNDWMERKNRDDQSIGWVENGEALRRSALRVDARKWVAGKLRPKKYGDKLELEHSGEVKTKIDVSALENLTAEQRDQLRSIAQAIAGESAGDPEGT